MATANFTEDGKQNTFERLVCSVGLTAGLHGHLTFLSVLNICLSITAVLGNTLILVALHKETSLHPPSKLLLRSLTTTDLCVGIITEPLVVIFWMSVMNQKMNICRYIYVASSITSYILCSVSLLTLTAISVDRLLALSLGVRYRSVVTLKRTYIMVITFGVVSTIAATMYFWSFLITEWYGYIVIPLCLVTSMFSYTKIFLTLRRHQNQVQDLHQWQPLSQASPRNIARYRKAVSSALWLQLALIVCYLPEGIVGVLWTNSGLSSPVYLAGRYTTCLVYLNSSLNPILYCWKIREVRQAVKDTIRQLACCWSRYCRLIRDPSRIKWYTVKMVNGQEDCFFVFFNIYYRMKWFVDISTLLEGFKTK